MSDMLLEIDEALRAQQIKALWDKYGQWIITAAVAIVVATAVGTWWHAHTNTLLAKDTAELMTLLQNEAENDSTAEKLAAMGKTTHAPLNTLVSLYEAQKLEQANGLKAAQSAYQSIIKDGKAPAVMRDLARVHYVRLGLVLNDKPETLLPVIEPLAKSRTSFKGTALEMKGLLLIKQGKTQEANTLFEILSKDEAVPSTLRQRARSMIHYEAGNAK